MLKTVTKSQAQVLKASRQRKIKIVLAGFPVIFIVFIVLHPLWLPLIYAYLDVSLSPQPADVIVVLGGSNGERELRAAELYRHGYASRILVSGFEANVESNLDILRRNNIPDQAISVNRKATSTFDEAQQVLAMLVESNAASALIVTDRPHTRRALSTYRFVFQNQPIELTFVATEADSFASSWWQINRTRDYVALEYLKILYYWINYEVKL